MILAFTAGTALAVAPPAAFARHHKHAHAAGSTKAADKPSQAGKKAHKAAGAEKHHSPAATHHHAVRHAAVRHAAPAVAAGAAAGAAGAAAGSTAQPPAAAAPAPEATDKGSNTGLPLPRFAALRADKVYMRRGPGDRYPIDWVYHRRGLPVQIDREFDVWRLVEDSDGQKGWVHQATLYGSRTFVIPGLPPEGVKAEAGEASAKAGDHVGRADARILGRVKTQEEARAHKNDVLLMSHPEEDSSVIAVLEPGTVGNIKLCPQNSQWCQVTVKGYGGWLPRRLFWGLLPGETIQSK
ncbi:aspartyl-tRNA synthetase [Gluconobacter morbifer G707]|uniref:Aspartyl-tRNA synthetase n=2 Tax=Gluconobacter TaxID=441 RepID=G6XIV2_9PROT|nr:aspartyl-tRNA synthetase [Gluconobacter morbifer G707]